jgi:hypothetical protein
MTENRITMPLIIDILDTLERHGYHQHDDQHTGQAIGIIADLTRVYEGTREAPYGTYLGQPADTGQAAAILTRTEVSTIATALDEARYYQRDQLATCTDCADRSCGTCQRRLQAADTYNRLAIQILQADQTSRTPARSPAPHHQPQAETGTEAGQ